MPKGWQVGIDIGGTFTDVVAFRPDDGEVRAAKVDARTDDRVAGLLAALSAVDLEWSDVDDLIHGTTMVTNAIVEDDLADVALVTTDGFSDTLAIGRQNRRHLYRLDLPPKPAPQVRSENCLEVDGRLDSQGGVLRPLSKTSVDSVIERIGHTKVAAVAVSLLHSYADSCHEEELGNRLREKFPYVALSNRVNPEAREYERMATTVLSASVMPLIAGYLDILDQARPRDSRLHLFHSAGGMASPDALRELPLGLAMSGPAAGVAAAGRVARQLDIDHAISFDMGGTTTDVCLILGGQAQISSNRSLAGRPLRLPMVAVESIGAGGGSIARYDHGALAVGPTSAGANPGPACYRRGGLLPTVSDANLLLGYMDSERVLGGNLTLDSAAARNALAPLAAEMGMTVEAAALGIVKVVNSAMVGALRRITVERGIDGRKCALLAYGGAGPMHCVEVARVFGISRVIVPNHSSAFSALGCVNGELSYSQQQTVHMSAEQWDARRLDSVRRSLKARLFAPLQAAGFEENDAYIEEVASIRYRGQSYALEIPNPTYDDVPRLGKAFFDMHDKLYGFVTAEPWELVAIRQRVSISRPARKIGAAPAARGALSSYNKVGSCVFGAAQAMRTPRYARSALGPGDSIEGPAIIEDEWSTVVIPPGATLIAVDQHAHLHIDTGERQ